VSPASDETAKAHPSVVRRSAVAFGRFWWDFLIGDTPELFAAALAVIGLALLLHRDGGVAIVVVLAAVIGCLALSTWKGRSRSK
jgi:hypothetical protein